MFFQKEYLGLSWARFGLSWAYLGPSWGCFEVLGGPSWAVLAVLGTSWGRFGRSWAFLGRPGPVFDRLEPSWGRIQLILGQIGGPCCWANFGVIFATQFEQVLEPVLNQFWANFEVMLGSKIRPKRG